MNPKPKKKPRLSPDEKIAIALLGADARWIRNLVRSVQHWRQYVGQPAPEVPEEQAAALLIIGLLLDEIGRLAPEPEQETPPPPRKTLMDP